MQEICPNIFIFLKGKLHWRVRKCPAIPTPEAIKQHVEKEVGKIGKYPNTEETRPKDDASHKFPAVARFWKCILGKICFWPSCWDIFLNASKEDCSLIFRCLTSPSFLDFCSGHAWGWRFLMELMNSKFLARSSEWGFLFCETFRKISDERCTLPWVSFVFFAKKT